LVDTLSQKRGDEAMKPITKMYRDIAVKIQKIQITLNVNDTQLAKMMGKTRQRVSDIKKSLQVGRGVQASTLHNIAKALGVDVQDFFD